MVRALHGASQKKKKTTKRREIIITLCTTSAKCWTVVGEIMIMTKHEFVVGCRAVTMTQRCDVCRVAAVSGSFVMEGG